MDLLQVTTIACLLATGMGVALLGSVKLALARKLQIDEARVGGMVALFGFTMIPVMLTVGFATDLVGKQPVIIGGSVLMAVSLVVLGLARRYVSALVGVLLLSAAWAMQINVVNPLAPLAFGGTKVYATNLACFYFGIGAFLTPLGVAYLLRRLGFTPALLVLAALVLVTAVAALGVDFSKLGAADKEEAKPAATAPSGGSQPAATAPSDEAKTPATAASGKSETAGAARGMGALLRDPVMWLCALALFFFAPLEGTMGAWATTYLRDRRVSEGWASGLLSGFWLTYLLARLVTAFTLPKGGEANLILVLAIVCIGVWLAVVLSRGRAQAAALVLVAGVVFGPIYPTIMAVLLDHFDEALHGRAVGLLFAIGGLGWTALPMLIGAYAQRKGIQRAFLLAAASAVGLTVIALILTLYRAA